MRYHRKVAKARSKARGREIVCEFIMICKTTHDGGGEGEEKSCEFFFANLSQVNSEVRRMKQIFAGIRLTSDFSQREEIHGN